ncbi:MAG: NapC/NirT family cytochrome c [Thermoanaerobaculia bacterium]
MRTGILGALLLFAADRLAASPERFGVPQPHGWIGTTNQWIRGAGIAFAIFNLVLLLVIWRKLRRGEVSTVSKALLFGAILVIPVFVVFLATAHGMQESMTVDACGSCHVMDGHVRDLRDPGSDSLAAVHYKNRYIQENHCYTCHSDYGMYGTLRAKLDGLGHVWHNSRGDYPRPIRIAHPYSNLRCLSCHGNAQNFLAKHEKDEIPKLLAGQDSCLDCHGPAHKAEETKASK